MLDIIGYVALGLFLLVVPGFLFSLVLYPKLESLDFWARVGVSLGLGALLLIYVGLFVARPELRMLQFAPFAGVTLALCVALAILAYVRGGAEVVVAYTRAAVRSLRKSTTGEPEKKSQEPPRQGGGMD